MTMEQWNAHWEKHKHLVEGVENEETVIVQSTNGPDNGLSDRSNNTEYSRTEDSKNNFVSKEVLTASQIPNPILNPLFQNKIKTSSNIESSGSGNGYHIAGDTFSANDCDILMEGAGKDDYEIDAMSCCIPAKQLDSATQVNVEEQSASQV